MGSFRKLVDIAENEALNCCMSCYSSYNFSFTLYRFSKIPNDAASFLRLHYLHISRGKIHMTFQQKAQSQRKAALQCISHCWRVAKSWLTPWLKPFFGKTIFLHVLFPETIFCCGCLCPGISPVSHRAFSSFFCAVSTSVRRLAVGGVWCNSSEITEWTVRFKTLIICFQI